jgi:hypothetical protein
MEIDGTIIDGYQAQPITPPQRAQNHGSYTCIVDYDHKPYSITWSGSPEYPDLMKFPNLEDVKVSPKQQSLHITKLWSDSNLLDYGSHASIRITDDEAFPILKLAHPDKQSIGLIQYEFKMLNRLAMLDVPVVAVCSQPLLDEGVICGYRMKMLFKLQLPDLRSRRDEVWDALCCLHSAGYCHGDISPSNIMKDGGGKITLVDFSFAGQLGSDAPLYIPSWVYANGVFDIETDTGAFERFM